jgi:hypothetical protein
LGWGEATGGCSLFDAELSPRCVIADAAQRLKVGPPHDTTRLFSGEEQVKTVRLTALLGLSDLAQLRLKLKSFQFFVTL